MKANRRLRLPLSPVLLIVSLLVAGCSDRRIIPAPASTPAARPLPPAPPPQRAPSADWRDAPITPGDWSWSTAAGASVARFADDALVLRCEPGSGSVTLLRGGTAPRSGPASFTIVTTSATRTIAATPVTGPSPALAVTLRASDSLLDAIAFSRGRFAVEATGLPSLYVPSWPEVSRVVEDCR